jgi:hypothetical protein
MCEITWINFWYTEELWERYFCCISTIHDEELVKTSVQGQGVNKPHVFTDSKTMMGGVYLSDSLLVSYCSIRKMPKKYHENTLIVWLKSVQSTWQNYLVGVRLHIYTELDFKNHRTEDPQKTLPQTKKYVPVRQCYHSSQAEPMWVVQIFGRLINWVVLPASRPHITSIHDRACEILIEASYIQRLPNNHSLRYHGWMVFHI